MVASAGLRTSPSGLILHHKSANNIRRAYLDKVIVASNMPEIYSELLLETLNLELTRAGGEMREASAGVSRFLISNPLFQSAPAEAIVATKEYLAVITSGGDIIEPEDGFVVIGICAAIVSGAMKALLAYSGLSSEQMVRESLRIASQLDPLAHDEVSVETV